MANDSCIAEPATCTIVALNKQGKAILFVQMTNIYIIQALNMRKLMWQMIHLENFNGSL